MTYIYIYIDIPLTLTFPLKFEYPYFLAKAKIQQIISNLWICLSWRDGHFFVF